MVNANDGLSKDITKTYLKEGMKSALKKVGASEKMIGVAVFVVDNSILYIEFCTKNRINPDDPKALAAFLESKSKGMLKLLDNDDLKCVIALYDFSKGLYKRAPMVRGGPIPATIVASLTLLDLLGIGNSCTFVQEAFYHAFLKSSSPGRLPTARPPRCEEPPSPQSITFPDPDSISQIQSGIEMRTEKDAIIKAIVPML
jgi:hypothetical protein